MMDLLSPSSFLWATGIEDTFIPHACPSLRALDEYELTQHYKLWKRDFDFVAETGVKAVRWGIPWYRVQPAPDRWDWAWTDKALDYLVNVKGIILTTQAIKAEHSNAITVQVEALWHTFTKDSSLKERVLHNNRRQYLCFDLTTGRVRNDYELLNYLYSHGATDVDLNWFRENALTFDFFGVNFYPWSYGELRQGSNGSIQYVTNNTSGDKIAIVIRETYERYHMPMIITETSANSDIVGRAQWMDETLATVRTLRAQSIPVVGYTWFPLFTMVDWAYRRGRRPLKDYLIHLGLYDSVFDSKGILRRRKTPPLKRYQGHIATPLPQIGN